MYPVIPACRLPALPTGRQAAGRAGRDNLAVDFLVVFDIIFPYEY